MQIEVQKTDITQLKVDAVVNAANQGLWAGGGVCGAIFEAAGFKELQAACREIGHCDTGSAVITPGFKLNAKNVIHAVGLFGKTECMVSLPYYIMPTSIHLNLRQKMAVILSLFL